MYNQIFCFPTNRVILTFSIFLFLATKCHSSPFHRRVAFQPYSTFQNGNNSKSNTRSGSYTIKRMTTNINKSQSSSSSFVSAARYYQFPFRKRRFNFRRNEKEYDSNENEKHNSSLPTQTQVATTKNNIKEEETSLEYFKDKISMFTEMAMPYYQESKSGRWLFAGMIALTLLNSGVSVAFSYVGKDFWNALNSKDQEQFYTMMFKYAAALLVGSPVSVFYSYQRERLAVAWREWMTDRVLQLYSSNRVYYALERETASEIDNPDQRITEDVRSFTTFSLQLFLTLTTSLIDLVSFSFILYSIQPQLFGTIIAYALFGTLTTTALGKKLVGLNYEKLQKEADFRYSLVRIRENAESIAFYAGEDIEGKEVSKRLDKVIENKKDIIVVQRNLGKRRPLK